MLRRFAILWIAYAALFAFISGGVFSWSLRPHPQEQNQKLDEASPKPNQGGNHQNQPKSLWDRTWDDAVALYTAILTVFTGLLAVVSGIQIAFLVQADKTSRIAADAAKESAEALPALERAYMFIKPNKPVFSYNVETQQKHVSVELHFANLGRTPAIITSLDLNFDMLTDAPDNTLALPSNTVLDDDTVVGAGSPWGGGTCYFPRVLDQEDIDSVDRGQVFLWLYGTLSYEDIFGNRRITRFRWRYNGRMKLFMANGGKPYNERT